MILEKEKSPTKAPLIKINRKLVEKKEHKRPNMGFLNWEVNVVNQDDKVVQTGVWVILVQRKES